MKTLEHKNIKANTVLNPEGFAETLRVCVAIVNVIVVLSILPNTIYAQETTPTFPATTTAPTSVVDPTDEPSPTPSQAPMLAATAYSTREELDAIFANSIEVYEYLDSYDLESPLVLSKIAPEGESVLQAIGLRPQVIDRNVESSKFVFLYHTEPEQAPRLSFYGEVFPLTNHHTLIKLPDGETFTHTGVAAEFELIPLSVIRTPPPYRERTITPTPEPKNVIEEEINSPRLYMAFTGILTAGLVFGGAKLYKRVRRRDI